MPYRKGPFGGIHFDRIYRAIFGAAEKGVERTGNSAMRIALNKVPVRKVFSGGRQKTRQLSPMEIVAEASSFARAFPQSTPFSGPSRMGTSRVTFRNQANLYRNTRELRRATEEEGHYSLTSPGAEYGLTARGRYELSTGRAVIQPQSEMTLGALKALEQEARAIRAQAATRRNPNGLSEAEIHARLQALGRPHLQLGGGLRDSIRLEHESTQTIAKVAVVAGNDRVKYAKYVEFGTRHAPSQPYLRPALAGVRDKLRPNVYAALAKIGK